jgi:uncharacterized membrane protein
MIILRNILAVVFGLVVGGGVNMSLIMTGSLIIPPPAGVDVADAQSIAASMHAFELKHFVFPILAHALGTLVGATTACLIAASNEIVLAYVIGVAFLAGGIAASFMIPAPVWFIILDLLVAYLPMAWLGTLIGSRIKG